MHSQASGAEAGRLRAKLAAKHLQAQVLPGGGNLFALAMRQG